MSASSPASQARGVITFQTGFLATLLDFSWDNAKRESLDTTTMAQAAPGAGKFGNKTSIPSNLSDPGELTCEIQHNHDTKPPLDAAPETVTVKAGDATTQAAWAATGYMTSYTPKGVLDGSVMKATCKIKFSGNVTVTAGT